MGLVYRGEDPRRGGDVALKFPPAGALGDAQRLQRFRLEARTAIELDHPNICKVHELVEEGGETFIVMELLSGPTLQERLALGPLLLPEALAVLTQAGDGLAAAHRKGVIHRDLSSSNLMYCADGSVKVMDFGLARALGRTRITSTGTQLGTPAYMSPEQALARDADRRSDIWSFGVVLYQAIAGRLPFEEEHEPALLYSILNEDFEPVDEGGAEFSGRLNRVLSKALAKEPEKRYQHVEEAVADLRGLSRRFAAGF